MLPRPPKVPAIDISPVDGPPPEKQFLRLSRQWLRAVFPNGRQSEPFAYDHILREALDAVVIVAHYRDEAQREHVYLRSCVRPPLALRGVERGESDGESSAVMWEIPAGLVEPEEQNDPLGPAMCASREIREELGFAVPAADMQRLGPTTYPAPAVLAERHFYFHCLVDPNSREEPVGDGSALEQGARVIDVLLRDALRWVRAGMLQDAKTEMALRRLEELVA